MTFFINLIKQFAQRLPDIRLGLWLWALLAGCSAPGQWLDRQASNLGFQRQLLEGQPFRHVAYVKGQPCARGLWHIYLEGDGQAWLSARRVATDPTPRHSFLFELMASDPAASLYLGRPCYHGRVHDPGCHPLLWTQQRYSDTVVTSLVAALKKRLPAKPCQLVLIGYSGGGALAMLMAARLPQVAGVVTLAGNLDVAAWTQRHGYTPLSGSLDPAKRLPLPRSIFQVHVSGAEDREIPTPITRAALLRYPDADFLIVKDLNHKGNWLKIWPEVLEKIQRHSTTPQIPRGIIK